MVFITIKEKGGIMSIISLSFQQWNKIQDNSNSLILIEFWADWCGPCKEMTTIYQDTQHKNEFNEKNKNLQHVSFFQVNIDAEQELTQLFNIKSIPALIGLRGKDIVFQYEGSYSPLFIEDKIDLLRNSSK